MPVTAPAASSRLLLARCCPGSALGGQVLAVLGLLGLQLLTAAHGLHVAKLGLHAQLLHVGLVLVVGATVLEVLPLVLEVAPAHGIAGP